MQTQERTHVQLQKMHCFRNDGGISPIDVRQARALVATVVVAHAGSCRPCGASPRCTMIEQTFMLGAVTATRSLKQAGGVEFPGCTFLRDSVLARNPDFQDFYISAEKFGLLSFLENLTSPATLFIPTNEALNETNRAANLTREEALNSPLAPGSLNYFIVTEPIMVQSSAHGAAAALHRTSCCLQSLHAMPELGLGLVVKPASRWQARYNAQTFCIVAAHASLIGTLTQTSILAAYQLAYL